MIAPSVGVGQGNQADPKLTEVWEPVPRIVTPGRGAAPPSDAIVLFSGGDLSQWVETDGTPAKWKVEDGAFTVVKGTGNLRTRRAFGDCQLHIEWRAPKKVEGEGQERGNSGVFLQGRYEVQVLDSYGNRTFSNGQRASIYKQYIPLVNASRKPGEWQTYDIFYRAPRFADDGTVKTPGYMIFRAKRGRTRGPRSDISRRFPSSIRRRMFAGMSRKPSLRSALSSRNSKTSR